MNATIYHNPHCSKSRNTLKLLQDNGLIVTEVLYLDSPPSKNELRILCNQMGKSPFEIVRVGEVLFKELGFTKSDQKTDEEWLDILIEHPKLIERPIVQVANKAVMGRPPENVLQIIS